MSLVHCTIHKKERITIVQLQSVGTWASIKGYIKNKFPLKIQAIGLPRQVQNNFFICIFLN